MQDSKEFFERLVMETGLSVDESVSITNAVDKLLEGMTRFAEGRNTPMKILVFDDSATHRAAAQAQLRGHDVTVVGTYDEAQKLLLPNTDSELQMAFFAERFGDRAPYNSEGIDTDTQKLRCDFYWGEAKKNATTYPNFDVVLTDLLVPASQQAQGGKGQQFVGQEMPVGILIGLLAAVKGCAKYVAVFTDSDHHSHPASACFDVFNHGECKPAAFVVEGCKVILTNNRNWVSMFDPKDLGRELEFSDSNWKSGTPAKNWAALLEYLIK